MLFTHHITIVTRLIRWRCIQHIAHATTYYAICVTVCLTRVV